jgi:hypothetical protein
VPYSGVVTQGTTPQVREARETISRGAAWLAWSVCAVSLSILAVVLLVILLGWSTPLPHGLTPWRGQAVSLVGVVGAPVLGGLIASRQPNNPYGWLWLAFGLGLALQLLGKSYAAYGVVVQPAGLMAPQTVAHLLRLGGPMALTLVPFLLLLFPTGRLPSRRWRSLAWIAGLSGAMLVSLNLLFDNPHKVGGTITAVALIVKIVNFAAVFLSALSLVVRFRRASGVERRQLKWVALAALVAAAILIGGVLGFLAVVLLGVLLGLERILGDAFLGLLNAATNTAIYVGVGVAILRPRLYDIDRIINRALVYGPLTATLALVYIGGVVGMQAIVHAINGKESTLVVVASTLAIAALFNPLRRRVQAFVDRHFYRSKYDAAKTLEAFGARLRNETDLDALSNDLVEVARETMQPTHVSLWLSPDLEAHERSAALRQFGHEEEKEEE